MDSPDDVLIYPGKEFANAYEFFENFKQVGIPFMDGFLIQVVNDTDADGNDNICFKNAVISVVSKSAIALLASAMFIF